MTSQSPILYEGRITCLTFEDGERLYGPMSQPDSQFHRQWDRMSICGANEREFEDVVAFEHLHGILESEDCFRSPAMRRWRLASVSLLEPK